LINLVTGLMLFSTCVTAQEHAHIEVDVQSLTLKVWSADNQLLKQFNNIAIGSGGFALVHYQGDETTPLGDYHVLWINHKSPFSSFIGLDYPTPKHVDTAWKAKKLSEYERNVLLQASKNQRRQPTNTALGGAIGIHGIGKGNRYIHEHYNWTNGCVALTNEQLHELLQWVTVGMRVQIHK